MIPQPALLFLIGLALFLISGMLGEGHYRSFKATGARPFLYFGNEHKYPLWLNTTSLISIVLMVVGSSGWALLFLAPTAYEVWMDPDG